MLVYFDTVALEPNTRLDIRKNSTQWNLWNGENCLCTIKPFDDSKLGLDHYKVIINEDCSSARVVRFADLHRHSDNSLMDGIIKVPELVDRTEYAGALTDHGVVYGYLEFYKRMKDEGKHPIIGMEAYQEDLDGNLTRNHLILLVKNNEGYKNLLKIASESFDHFYNKPHVTWEMLKKYHDGLIVSTACLGGLIPKALQARDYDKAKDILAHFQAIFGDDLYLEIQRHGLEEEDIVNPQLIQMSKETGVPLIATTDSHYLDKKDSYAHEVALCLSTKRKINEPHFRFEGTGYHVHTSEEMERLFEDIPEVLDNSLRLAEKCHVDIKLGDVNLPDYVIPKPYKTPLEYFRFLCEDGFKKRFAGKPELTDPRYAERFEYEYGVIKDMHFESYFVIVQDFINFAKENNIYIGPGRGSAAGSLLAFCMGITDMDPIRFNLLFERFLNPERVSWPDIDTDIEHVGRQKVIEYITKKYGAECVCRIVTFGTMAAKMVLKDVARVLGYAPGWANSLAKMVPSEPKMTLGKAMNMNPELRRLYEQDPQVSEVIDIAKVLEGNKRHASQHACGLVISPGPVNQFLPTSMELNKETGEKGQTSQVIMTEVEELSLLKMDLLGLKNLTAIHEVIDTIKHTRGIDIKYQDIPLDDRETYQMLAKGLTGGVFQLESVGMTNVVCQMMSDIDTLPQERVGECFERLIAAVALYRPGPMDYIPNYISGMLDPSSVSYDCPEEQSVLSSTYGVMVYQEQLMQIAQLLAGYNLGEADLLRKACGKKKIALMEKEHDRFIFGNKADYDAGKAKHLIPGCVGNGIDQAIAEEIWNKMVKFASYAFNRSHAACYAWLAYITAYMACHWTPEFFCAMLNAFEEIGDKVKSYLAIAAKRNIKILAPDINKSMSKCTVESESIRIGFHTLANFNKYSKLIIDERKAHGPFADFQSFYERMCDAGNKPTKLVMESLIYSSALDSFGLNKAQLFEFSKTIENNYNKDVVNRQLGQFSLFDEKTLTLQPPECKELAEQTLMNGEFKAVGFYLTRHPVDALNNLADEVPYFKSLSDLADCETSIKKVATFGLIHDLKLLFTKNDDEMYVFTLEDRYNSIRCVMFPKRVPANKHRLIDGAVVKATGNFAIDEDRGNQLIVEDLFSEEEVVKQHPASITVEIRNKEEQNKLLNFIHENPGSMGVKLLANGHLYPINRKVELNAKTLDWLKENFSRVAV